MQTFVYQIGNDWKDEHYPVLVRVWGNTLRRRYQWDKVIRHKFLTAQFGNLYLHFKGIWPLTQHLRLQPKKISRQGNKDIDTKSLITSTLFMTWGQREVSGGAWEREVPASVGAGGEERSREERGGEGSSMWARDETMRKRQEKEMGGDGERESPTGRNQPHHTGTKKRHSSILWKTVNQEAQDIGQQAQCDPA